MYLPWKKAPKAGRGFTLSQHIKSFGFITREYLERYPVWQRSNGSILDTTYLLKNSCYWIAIPSSTLLALSLRFDPGHRENLRKEKALCSIVGFKFLWSCRCHFFP